jgi:CheY-like chemotaxis protein
MPVQLGLKSPGQLPPFAPGPGMIMMLIVEDDPFQADSIMLLCEQCGYKAQVCSNGTEALEVVRTDASINLVLSDVMMAGVSGYELLCEIRKIRNSVSVSTPLSPRPLPSPLPARPAPPPLPHPTHPHFTDLLLSPPRLPLRPLHPPPPPPPPHPTPTPP